MLLKAIPRHEIVFTLSEKWECSYQNVDVYISMTKKLIQKNFDEETIADLDNHYNDLIRESNELKDPYLKKSVLDSKMKLKGVVSKVELSVRDFRTNWGDEPETKDEGSN
jgi:hypothetical protein